MGDVVATYSDGGLIRVNPSPIGGMWAFCHVNAAGERVASGSGLILACGGISGHINNDTAITLCYDCVYDGLQDLSRIEADKLIRHCAGSTPDSLQAVSERVSEGHEEGQPGVSEKAGHTVEKSTQATEVQGTGRLQPEPAVLRLLWPERLAILDHRSYQWRGKQASERNQRGMGTFPMVGDGGFPVWFSGLVPQLQLSEIRIRPMSPCWTCGRLDVAISNNVSEFRAMLAGLEALPDGWSGTVYSDSLVTIRRFRDDGAMHGIPLDWKRRAAMTLGRLGRLEFVLLDGHPSRAQLAAGVGKRGNPVSEHNVFCDQECTRIGREYTGAETNPKRAKKGEAAA